MKFEQMGLVDMEGTLAFRRERNLPLARVAVV